MTTEVQPPPAPPRAWKVALSGACGLALGLGLVGWSMGTKRPVAGPDERPAATASSEAESPAEPEAEAEAEAEAEVVSAAEAESEPEPEAEAESESESEVEPEAEPEAEADTTVPASTAGGAPGSTAFERGRVAFLRCGEPDVRCGRDRDFEEAAWTILAELPSCPALSGRIGTGDVRIHRTSGGRELRFREWGDTPLSIGALQSCLETEETSLADLPLTVAGSPVIVSFRFRLR